MLNSHQQQVTAGNVTQADAWRMDGAMLAVGVMVDLLKNKVRRVAGSQRGQSLDLAGHMDEMMSVTGEALAAGCWWMARGRPSEEPGGRALRGAERRAPPTLPSPLLCCPAPRRRTSSSWAP